MGHSWVRIWSRYLWSRQHSVVQILWYRSAYPPQCEKTLINSYRCNFLYCFYFYLWIYCIAILKYLILYTHIILNCCHNHTAIAIILTLINYVQSSTEACWASYAELAHQTEITASKRTIACVLHKEKFHHCIAIWKPYFSDAVKEKQLDWCRMYAHWDEVEWT